jgi:hypothetical protein
MDGWKIAGFEPDDEYLQDMSHEDLQSLVLKLKGYGEAADPLGRTRARDGGAPDRTLD